MSIDGDQRHYFRTLARLRRVNKQLALLDELDAMELMPNSLRPHVEPLGLDREHLLSLRDVLAEDLRELLLEYTPS